MTPIYLLQEIRIGFNPPLTERSQKVTSRVWERSGEVDPIVYF